MRSVKEALYGSHPRAPFHITHWLGSVINLFFQPFLNAAFHCAPVSLNPSHRLEGGKGATYLIIIDAAFEIGHREQQSII